RSGRRGSRRRRARPGRRSRSRAATPEPAAYCLPPSVLRPPSFRCLLLELAAEIGGFVAFRLGLDLLQGLAVLALLLAGVVDQAARLALQMLRELEAEALRQREEDRRRVAPIAEAVEALRHAFREEGAELAQGGAVGDERGDRAELLDPGRALVERQG